MGTIQETKPDPASGLSLFLIMQHEQQTALRNLISVTTTLMTASVHTITPPWYLVLLLLVLLACKLGLLLGSWAVVGQLYRGLPIAILLLCDALQPPLCWRLCAASWQWYVSAKHQ